MRVKLAPGEGLGNVTVPAQHGYVLTVRVNDPGKQLTSSIGGKLAASDIAISVAGLSGLPHNIPITSEDVPSGGKDQTITVNVGAAKAGR